MHPLVPCTLRVCGRKKLPFAGYSVVKELAFGSFSRRLSPSTLEGRMRDQLLSELGGFDQERFRSTDRFPSYDP
jgi:hypothetical protein